MRIDGWETRLFEVVEAARHEPYQLGSHDCFRFACSSIEALTGVDRWPEFAGYRTKRDALVRIARHGKSAESAGDWFCGSPSVSTSRAQRGDILLLQTEDGEQHLGVCLGAQAAFLHERGLLFVPTLTCICAWKIG